MDVAKHLLDILKVYKDNSDLISAAVRDIETLGLEGHAVLKRGLDERKRKLILKAIALLAPSEVPAKVIEVDGVDDAELLLCQDYNWLDVAVAIYLRLDSVSTVLNKVCADEFDDRLAYYVFSALASAWDHVELGEEKLVESVKSSVYECAPNGRKILENGRTWSNDTYQPRSDNPIPCKVIAFEACRDELRRFSLVTAVLVEVDTGRVIFDDSHTAKTSEKYTLDSTTLEGLEFEIFITNSANVTRPWAMSLSVLCSMFAEVHKLGAPDACKLLNSMLRRLALGMTACVERLAIIKRDNLATLLPTKADLQMIHNKNDESVRSRLRRKFDAREALVEGIRCSSENVQQHTPGEKSRLLNCIASRKVFSLGQKIVEAYRNQKALPVESREAGSASVFATFIYSSLDRTVVAEEYSQLFSKRKVNICHAKSGTQIFVPHSELVTMTTYGMDCKQVEMVNSQIFDYEPANRFAFLPHLLSILGLRNDDQLLSILHKEMDQNAYLVADPMTANVRACMLRSFETSKRTFRVSSLHEAARQVVGPDDYPTLVREAISLLARLGATVPKEYVGRSCFYDVTRDLKDYRYFSHTCQILFDRGVILDGVGCEVLDGNTISLMTENQEKYVIARIKPENLRKKPRDDDDEDLRAMEAALEGTGCRLMRPVFDVQGEVHLTVTRSDPGRGLLSGFVNCEAI